MGTELNGLIGDFGWVVFLIFTIFLLLYRYHAVDSLAAVITTWQEDDRQSDVDSLKPHMMIGIARGLLWVQCLLIVIAGLLVSILFELKGS